MPRGPQPPACPGLRSGTTLPAGAFGVPVPSWDGQGAFQGGCPLISLSRWWVPGGIHRRRRKAARFPRCCRLQPGSSLYPSLLPPRSAGLAAIPHDPGSPERSGKQEGSALAKERADVIWRGAGRCCFSPTFIAVLGDLLGSTPQSEAFRPVESGLTPKYAPEIFLSASKTPGPLGRGSHLAG